MAVKTKWAIIGTGYIANQFVSGMRAVEDAILEAVVSRSENSGKKFAQKYGCEKVYTDLKTMLDTEKIDIVYLAIPNSCHFEYIMEILERGIPVLSEKPMVDTEETYAGFEQSKRKEYIPDGRHVDEMFSGSHTDKKLDQRRTDRKATDSPCRL